jgi:mannose-6-phosphate isomerase
VDEVFSSVMMHYRKEVLPLWRGVGFNANLGLPFEAVSSDGSPLPPTRYRAMACARQLFVFALAGDLAHAKTLLNSLLHYFEDKQHGGWFYSVDALGVPKERQKDLYTHAFVVFATAHYAMRSRDPMAMDVLTRTVAWTDCFAMEGVFQAVMSEDFTHALEGVLQNPLMHLTEAWLAARDATGDAAFDMRIAQLATVIKEKFVSAKSGCITELPLNAVDNRVEPGHQFEWYWLVYGSNGGCGHTALTALREPIRHAYDFAVQYGVDAVTGGVCAALDDHGRMLNSTQRIWAQTEYLRALALQMRHDPIVRPQLMRQIDSFRLRFLHPAGWHECLDAGGTIIRSDMPSTTPYHLATALDALS